MGAAVRQPTGTGSCCSAGCGPPLSARHDLTRFASDGPHHPPPEQQTLHPRPPQAPVCPFLHQCLRPHPPTTHGTRPAQRTPEFAASIDTLDQGHTHPARIPAADHGLLNSHRRATQADSVVCQLRRSRGDRGAGMTLRSVSEGRSAARMRGKPRGNTGLIQPVHSGHSVHPGDRSVQRARSGR
jgi:hypothetical protein